VRRLRAVIPIGLSVIALAACGGGDDGGEADTHPAPSEAPSETTSPPAPGGLPPQIVECYADKGYEVDSPADIHSAPPEVLQECFQSLHGGGGAP
jgi:hypothetical protein